MGARSSSLGSGPCAEIDARVYELRQNDKNDIYELRRRHMHSLNGRLALGHRDFIELLRASKSSNDIFKVFDSDSNGLIDALEFLSAAAVISRMSIRAKTDFLFSLYDMRKQLYLTMEEFYLLLRGAAIGSAKIDSKLAKVDTNQLRTIAKRAFLKAERSIKSDISKDEFDAFVFSDPITTHFLNYFDQVPGIVPIPSNGSKWTSKLGVPDNTRSGATIRWLRPEEFTNVNDSSVLWLSQGALDDTGLLNALALVLSAPTQLKLFQSTGQEKIGRYAVQLHRDGTSRLIVIDDSLPCDATGLPLYARASQIWPLLVEKAVASLLGSFQALTALSTTEALVTLTGGVVQTISILEKENDDTVWGLLQRHKTKSDELLGAVFRRDARRRRHNNYGLLATRAYPILDTQRTPNGRRFVKLANLWMDAPASHPHRFQEHTDCDEPGLAEILFGFSQNEDDSAFPTTSSKSQQPTRQSQGEHYGYFWLDFIDFMRLFDAIHACRLFDSHIWTSQHRSLHYKKARSLQPQFYLHLPEAGELVLSLSHDTKAALGLLVAQYETHNNSTRSRSIGRCPDDARQVARSPYLVEGRYSSMQLQQLDAGTYTILPLLSSPSEGTVTLRTRFRSAHTLLNEDETQAATSDEVQGNVFYLDDEYKIKGCTEKEPSFRPDAEALSIVSLMNLLGRLWLQTHKMQEEQDRRLFHLAKLEAEIQHQKEKLRQRVVRATSAKKTNKFKKVHVGSYSGSYHPSITAIRQR